LLRAAQVAVRRLLERSDAQPASESALKRDRVPITIGETLSATISPVRSLKNIYSWADSLATYPGNLIAKLDEEDLVRVIRRLTIVLSSQFLSQILISRPQLAGVLTHDRPPLDRAGYVSSLRQPVAAAINSESRSDALRRAWYEQILEIGLRDMTGLTGTRDDASAASEKVDLLRQNNLAQTSLAEATLEVATEIAIESLKLSSWFADNRRFSILALGRLGHAGMDYGSDLDLMMVFDDNHPTALSDSRGHPALPEGYSSLQELYSALTSAIVGTLASITREGMIYRVDLRLRPEGKSGPVARGLGSLLSYISTRASAWELSAYLKVREVGGDSTFGAEAVEAIRRAVFDAAERIPQLSADLLDIRVRLEREKAKSGKIDLKWGRGGLTDAYFVTRYLQLANRVSFPPGLGTSALIAHLGTAGLLSKADASDLTEGYAFLRRLDHWMRLLLDRPTPVLPKSSTALKDLAIAMKAGSPEELELAVAAHISALRRVFNGVFGQAES
jgi:glutamate-ammonia-ligase adenylyltransferase